MKYTYQIHPLVEKDFEDGYIWYEEKQKGLGERFVNAVDTAIKRILQNPEAYGSRVKKSFREAQVDKFPYVVVYKISKKERKFTSLQSITRKSTREKNTENKRFLLLCFNY